MVDSAIQHLNQGQLTTMTRSALLLNLVVYARPPHFRSKPLFCLYYPLISFVVIVFLCLKLIVIHYHAQQQKKIKIDPQHNYTLEQMEIRIIDQTVIFNNHTNSNPE